MAFIRSSFAWLAVAAAVAACSTVAPKDQKESPVAGGVFPPLQDPSPGVKIVGTRASAGFARHDVVHGLDTGFIGNIASKDFVGAAASGIFHSTSGSATILLFQASGVTNLNFGKTRIVGLQVALGVNYSGAENRIYGIQLGGVGNFGSKTSIYGFQLGLYNEAETVYGFQIGLLNRTKNLHGMQIGVLNLASNNWLPVVVGLNVGF